MHFTGVEPFVAAARKALAAETLPPGLDAAAVAVPVVLAVLAEIYQHPAVIPAARTGDLAPADVDDIIRNLVTRTQIAGLRGAKVGTVMTWIERYDDFPKPVLGEGTHTPYWWWPDLRPYLDRMNLPRKERTSPAMTAAERDETIIRILRAHPAGLTTPAILSLSGEQGASPRTLLIRYEDRMRKLEKDGIIARVGTARQQGHPAIWALTGTQAAAAGPAPVIQLGFPVGVQAAAPNGSPPRPPAARPAAASSAPQVRFSSA